MIVVAVDSGPPPVVGRSEVLFDHAGYLRRIVRNFDLAPDGQQFLMLAVQPPPDSSARAPRIVIVQNWTTELTRRVPAR